MIFTFEHIALIKIYKEDTDSRFDVIKKLDELKGSANVHKDMIPIINECIEKLKIATDEQFSKINFELECE